MKALRTAPAVLPIGFALLLSTLALLQPVRAVESAKAKALFQHPPREYSTGPLWVWNDLLTEQQIRDSLQELAHQQVKQVWVHPRPGLMTPYLSADWFRLWRVALKEAERLDMNVWIYDENSYPSGFAGGLVPEAMPESRGRGLVFREVKAAPKRSDDLVGVYRLDGETCEDVTAKVKAGEALPEARYLVAAEVRAHNSPWHGNRCYVNLLSPGVTEKFLELTLEPYRHELGKQFGKRIPGSFTDEPNIRPVGDFPWSEVLVEEFQKRWGYNLLAHLPSLTQPVGDYQKVRHNYFQVLHEQFVAHWAKPYHDYCASNHLEFTGHYWDHEWPNCVGVPDNMAMYAWHQRPAIDCLMNQYAEHTHAQFGNLRMPKELSSVANQLGTKRTLCEVYGAGGWDLRFEDMKRIGDWLEVLGVNTLNQHLTYVTLRGARKRDHPQSFSYHEPWWEAYHVSAGYFARLSAALSQGEQVNRILVLEPTTTAWMYQRDGARLGDLGDSFFKLLQSLEAAQVEYDLGSEDVLAGHGSVSSLGLRVGQRDYQTVVIPPGTENLNAATAKLLADYLQRGGTVLSCGQAPARIDGSTSAQGPKLAQAAHWKAADPATLAKELASPGFAITRRENDKGILFHHRRQLQDGQLLFLVNTSIESASAGELESDLHGVEVWDLRTGKTAAYPFAKTGNNGIKTSFDLPPSGSLLLFLTQKPIAAPKPVAEATTLVKAEASPEVRRVQPNVLTLDYVDITAGGETRTNLYFYQANQFAWRQNGMDRDPWDSAVQYKDELISRKFPANSGFKASYRFTLAGAAPKNLAIVLERPDLYTITCNGQPVTARPNDWWLDRAFSRIPIASLACAGENVIVLQAAPFTMFHELEPAYVLGDFTLKAVAKGFVITPEQPLHLGDCNTLESHSISPDGTMWLSSGIGYRERGEAKDDRAPYLIFDLGRPVEVSAIRVWNYNEAHIRDLTTRGVKAVRLSGAVKNEAEAFTIPLGTFQLARAQGGQSVPETLLVHAQGVRYVRFDILANHNGVSYPAASEPEDHGFVGLAEVQFVAGAQGTIRGVKVARVSSELKSHQRLAGMLVDGSGLSQSCEGWNAQGHPFYSAGVAYRERFRVAKPAGRYVVALPNWYGSVAKVSVNGKPAGFIDAPPWDCEVTKWIQRGSNEIEVTVIGTLKNLLGPHHGNPALGAAWPSGFHKGPESGPPPGASYSNVAYGLFEPFVLKQITPQ